MQLHTSIQKVIENYNLEIEQGQPLKYLKSYNSNENNSKF